VGVLSGVKYTTQKKKDSTNIMNMPQKVKHYLGRFLWKENLSMIMHLNLNV
jgi:hypothetical protein